MKQQIALTAVAFALLSSTVFAKENPGESVSSYKALVNYNMFVSPQRPLRRIAPGSLSVMIVKDTVTETLDRLHHSLTADLNAKVEAAMTYSLLERIE